MTTSRIEKITQRIGKIFWDDFNAKAEELVRKEVTKAYQAGIDEAVERKGWKGYVAVDPKADNYKYSPVFSDRKGAELWVKGKEINGLEVVEVDILLVDHSELDQDKALQDNK